MTPPKRPYDREKLISEIMLNRMRSKNGGHGPQYWDSVADTIERELNLYPYPPFTK